MGITCVVHTIMPRSDMNILKVAMIADMPEPGELIDGGVQAVTSYLVRAMHNLPDIELHVVRLSRGVPHAKSFTQGRHRLHVLPMSRLGTLTGFRQDQRTLDNHLALIRPDVVHSQGAGHYGILASRTRFPVVITVHGILSEEYRYEPTHRRRLRLALQSMLSDRRCVRGARHTILISQYVANFYGRRLSGQKYLIPNPVDDRFFNVLRRDYGGKILFAGRLRELKGVTDLLQAVALIDSTIEASVTLAGSTSDRSYVQQLKELARRLGIEHRIRFAGLLDTSQLLREFASCSCLVLPSYQETAPLVIQEAMAAGVPVIASSICGIPFQVMHGETGFTHPPGDINALARLLSDLLKDSGLRSFFGQNAKDFAAKNYMSSAVAKATVNVYKNII